MKREVLEDGTIQLSFTYKERAENRKFFRKKVKYNKALYRRKRKVKNKKKYDPFYKTWPHWPKKTKRYKIIVEPKPRLIMPATVWSQAYYFAKKRVNTRLTKKEASPEDWFDALYFLINKRSVVLPEVWNQKKITKYVLMGDYRKGKTIYDTILQYCKHANTDKEMVRKLRIPTSAQYKLLPPTSRWKKIARNEDFRVQGID